MKTVILDSNNNVINVGAGEPENSPPEGIIYMVVEDDVWVGPGFKLDANGNFSLT